MSCRPLLVGCARTPQAVQAQVQQLGILDPSRRLTLTVVPAPPKPPVAGRA